MRPHRDGNDEERLRRGAVVGTRRPRVEREERLRAALVGNQILENAVEGRVHARERACTAGVRLDELEPERPWPDTLRRLLRSKRRADLDRAAGLQTDCPATEVPAELRVGRSALVDDEVLAECAHDLPARHPELEYGDGDH